MSFKSAGEITFVDGSREQIGIHVLDTYAPFINYSTQALKLLISLALATNGKCFIGKYQLLSQMLILLK
jgi:hypothetical protein